MADRWSELYPTEDFPKDYTYEEREPGIYKGSTDIAEVLRDMIPFSSLLTKGFTPETLQDSIMEMIPAPPAAIMAVKMRPDRISKAIGKVIPEFPTIPDNWRSLIIKKAKQPWVEAKPIDAIRKEAEGLGAIKNMLKDEDRLNLIKRTLEISKPNKRTEWPITLVNRERATMPMGMTVDRLNEIAAIARAKEGVASPPASTYISEQLKGKIKEKGYVPEVQREIVESFATTPDRKALTLKAIDDFMKIQNEFGKEMKGGRMYLGGSFTSAKPNPEDLDLIVRFPEKLYNTNRSAYDELTNDIGTLANFYASKKSPIHFVLSENLRHLDKFRDVGKLRYGPDYTWQRVLGLGALGLPAISYFGSENDGK